MGIIIPAELWMRVLRGLLVFDARWGVKKSKMSVGDYFVATFLPLRMTIRWRVVVRGRPERS